MESLVGYTGFVGANLTDKHNFDNLYNSQNIERAFGTKPDLLVYSGVPAEMYLASSNPPADLAIIENAAENIRKIEPKQLVLVSTIAVLDNTKGVDEDYIIDASRLTAYGLHRYKLEQMARELVPHCFVARLPALFGKKLKKNFIYDLIHYFPALLNKTKFDEFTGKESIISDCYILQENGFYRLTVSDERKSELRCAFERLKFSALNFTDSRSVFQFYNLAYFWDHINIALNNGISLLNLAAQPLSAREIYREIIGNEFSNEVSENPFGYDFRTKHDSLFSGINGYIFSREHILKELKAFVEENK